MSVSGRPHFAERNVPPMAPLRMAVDGGVARYDSTEYGATPAPVRDAPLVHEVEGSTPIPHPEAPLSHPPANLPGVVSAEGPKYLDDELCAAEHTSTYGHPALARFLTRQMIRHDVENLAAQARTDSPEGDGTTRLIVSVNCAPRAPERPGNLQVSSEDCRAVDASIFGPGGLIEALPPLHAASAIAAATAGDDKIAFASHKDVVKGVARVLTTVKADPQTGAREIERPTFEQIVDGVGVWDNAREGRQPDGDKEPYPEHPESLTSGLRGQIDQLRRAANSARLDPVRQHMNTLRARLDDLLQDQIEGHFEDLLPPDGPLLPAQRSGPGTPPVHVARISVGSASYGAILDAEVRAAGMGALAIVAGMPQGRPERLVIEGAEELAERDPATLREILATARRQEPPVPVNLVFTRPTERMHEFRADTVVVVGPLGLPTAESIGRMLPAVPMSDLVSVTNNDGANDGVNVGVGTNIGYDPDKTKANSGTSSTAGTSSGTNAAISETVQHTVRPLHGVELAAAVAGSRAIVYTMAQDGTPAVEIYDLQEDGIKVADGLPKGGPQPTLDVRADIDRIKGAQKREAARGSRTDSVYTTDALPALPASPAPPKGAGSRTTPEIATLRRGAQLQQLSFNAGMYGKVDVELLRDHGIDEWRRQEGYTGDGPDARESWIKWCAERNQSRHMAAAAWRARQRRGF